MAKYSAVILAAGRSTRMRSTLPKVLQPVCGRPLITYPVAAASKTGIDQLVIVTSSDQQENFTKILGDNKKVCMAVQNEQLGTADAVKAASGVIDKSSAYTLIIPGDVPLIRPETIKKLINETVTREAVVGLLSMEMNDPANYGRIVRGPVGNVSAIVEARDATSNELLLREVNSGIYFVKTVWLFDALLKVEPKNAQKEYYLTDIIKIATSNGEKAIAVCVHNAKELMGVNTRLELSLANRVMRRQILERLMAEGVGILDEENTYIDDDINIGQDTIIQPCCFITGTTKIGRNCNIGCGVVIKNATIGDDVVIKPYSVIEDCEVRDRAQLGPFARLRPGAVIEEEVKIGNFVEIKKSIIKKGAKASHLTYIGDAVVGERTNVGCGTITCNYDGKEKHRTVIGSDVNIGSAVQFVAPVEIGSGSTIGAGSTITENVPENSLAIARQRQVIKTGWKGK